MVGHLLGAAGAVEAIATIQVSVALLEAKCKIAHLHVDVSLLLLNYHVALDFNFFERPRFVCSNGRQCCDTGDQNWVGAPHDQPGGSRE